jgi:murein L,D-transpeptidase YcbB/YkuD
LGPTLKPGSDDVSVAKLRDRLEYFADTATSANKNRYFDSDLEQLVRNFQRSYGLFEDGLVGQITQLALNRSAAAHVAQLRVNLERIRWIFRDIEENYLAVNIAAFHAAYIERGEIVWNGRAVVGRRFRQTPSFKATMTHMIFNPTWTVPPTILKEDILPAMREDPTYLQRKNLRVLNHTGTHVDPLTIDWQHANGGNFPYLLRQDPGPQNALGRVKFIFPNRHLVYVHDTPSRELFDRAERTFSSGCIRIERPLELAEILLRGKDDPTRPKVEQFLAMDSPHKVDLKHPVTVMLLYLTAFTSQDGVLQFRRDIYGRDPAVLRALDGPFKFVPPKGYSNVRVDPQLPAKTDAPQ